MSLFKSISARLIIPLVISMSLGFLLLIQVLINLHEDQLNSQHDLLADNVLDSVNAGLRSVMIGGYADIAQDYAAYLHDISGLVDFSILRIDGTEAFRDNKTIDEVNERKGDLEFFPRDDEETVQIIAADNPALRKVVELETTEKIFSTGPDGVRLVNFVAPIKNGDECFDCHGRQQSVRGVMSLTLSLEDLDSSVRRARELASVIVFAVSVLLLISLTYFVRRLVAQPLQRINRAMTRISAGDYEQKVPDLGASELKVMAHSFNQMSEDLKFTYQGLEDEHDKITTLIHTSLEGMIVTDRLGDIVLVNPSAERILKKSIDTIISEGFLQLFDDADIMRAALSTGNIDKQQDTQIQYRDRTLLLKASSMHNSNGQVIGSAALIRDITEAAAMRKELEWLSTTDALTNIYNRRFLDNQLAEELERVERYGNQLAIFLFDIDHFKNFNDAWGHDQGDRVLQVVAQVLKDSLRSTDFACRYGGEEFLAILPNTCEEGAYTMAERLRQRVAETEVDGLNVTISIGIAAAGDDAMNADELVRRADEAMYLAKGQGRNRVRCHSQIGKKDDEEGMV